MTPLRERFRKGFGRLLPPLVDLLSLPQCACCGKEIVVDDVSGKRVFFCGDCRNEMFPHEWNRCRLCGGVIFDAAKELCIRCVQPKIKLPHFDRVIPLGVYAGTLRACVLRMKSPQGVKLAAMMAEAYCVYRAEPLRQYRPDLVVPVPMHWLHRLWRRTNSPETMARRIARCLGVYLEVPLLIRRKRTEPQHELSRQERFRNVKNAFVVRKGYDLTGARVLLIDDILTTGATANEAARVLKKAGAAEVVVGVTAKTLDGNARIE